MHVTLDLLPPEKKRELRGAFALLHAQRLLLSACVVAAFCAATILGVRMMLASTRDDLKGATTGETAETSAFAEKSRAINVYLARVNGLEDRAIPASRVLLALTELAPDGVRYTDISMDKEGVVRVSGGADTRAQVLELKTRLEASPQFTAVKAPLSNILQQRDVKFDFEMTRTP